MPLPWLGRNASTFSFTSALCLYPGFYCTCLSTYNLDASVHLEGDASCASALGRSRKNLPNLQITIQNSLNCDFLSDFLLSILHQTADPLPFSPMTQDQATTYSSKPSCCYSGDSIPFPCCHYPSCSFPVGYLVWCK